MSTFFPLVVIKDHLLEIHMWLSVDTFMPVHVYLTIFCTLFRIYFTCGTFDCGLLLRIPSFKIENKLKYFQNQMVGKLKTVTYWYFWKGIRCVEHHIPTVSQFHCKIEIFILHVEFLFWIGIHLEVMIYCWFNVSYLLWLYNYRTKNVMVFSKRTHRRILTSSWFQSYFIKWTQNIFQLRLLFSLHHTKPYIWNGMLNAV